MAECGIAEQSQGSRRRIAWEYAGVLAAALALYAVSCAPGALWQDSGMIQYRVWHNDIEGKLGLALAHPLYYIVAIGVKHFPVGSFLHRVNLISAAAGAIAVANLYLLMRLWLHKVWPAAVAAISLALSHTFWQHASIAETYTMYTAMLLGELVLLLRFVQTTRIGWLYGLAILNGLAVSVHMFAAIPLMCYLAFAVVLAVRKDIRLRQLVVCGVLWVIGAAAYEYLIIKHAIETADITGTLASAAFGYGYKTDVLNMALSWGIVKENVLYIMLNFPTPNVVLGAVGVFALRRLAPRASFGAVIMCVLVGFLAFAFRYTVVDRYSFFIPFYAVFALVLGCGAQYVMEKKKCSRLGTLVLLFALLPIPTYVAAPWVARKFYPQLGVKRETPYRDSYTYFLRPWQTGYRGPGQFADEVLESVPHGAVIWADTTVAFPLLAAQEIQQKRSDVEIVTTIAASYGAAGIDESRAAELAAQGLLYVVSPVEGYCPSWLLAGYDFVEAGKLWRVVPGRRFSSMNLYCTARKGA
ncbi:MAG TPA: DUF2723 domain-containing protein [Anaerohalosphaeraceae bacterium]|nr:DUF2723 domain-containing protein [Anaerohalosphaeraceae bacterium]HRT49892.1 DUF2723 domain-containing protein [Anaerohalosphaeraceae bacterium]HRT86784.1 DUF2723 domain-containing protein [Anaerohalosphaeraceae bacterium]